MTTHTAERLVDIPAGPQERPGWGPLLVMLAGTFMTFLDSNNQLSRRQSVLVRA